MTIHSTPPVKTTSLQIHESAKKWFNDLFIGGTNQSVKFDLAVAFKEIPSKVRELGKLDYVLADYHPTIENTVLTEFSVVVRNSNTIYSDLSKRFEEVAENIVERKIQHTNNNQIAFCVSISVFRPEKFDPYYKDTLASFTFLMEKP